MTRNSNIVLFSALVLLAGCSLGPAPGTPTAYTQLETMQTAPAEHIATPRYVIDITYPLLPESAATLAAALQQTGASAKQAFLDMLPDPAQDSQFADRQAQLKLDFSVAARSPRFISVREKGWADTGGAHPVPIDAGLVYDRQAGQLITLAKLFSDPQQAREQLAQRARSVLQQRLLADVPNGGSSAQARREWLANMREMIAQGTQPTAENYRSFLVLAPDGRATGLRLIFPAYQVAPYAYGMQTVDVRAAALADLLKPEYRSAFTAAGPAQ